MLEEAIANLALEIKGNRIATEANTKAKESNTEVMEELIVLINQGLDDGCEEQAE